VLVKPAGGGGGIGMLPAKDEAELLAAVERSRSMAERGFGNAEVYLERLVERPRHVEFQVLGRSAWQRRAPGSSATAPRSGATEK